jgi:delta-aminolevulinic acid dehydratase/porphobilinogen synthase
MGKKSLKERLERERKAKKLRKLIKEDPTLLEGLIYMLEYSKDKKIVSMGIGAGEESITLTPQEAEELINKTIEKLL